ncbi:acylphosphatase [Bacillaceae bacterium S4-13-58]
MRNVKVKVIGRVQGVGFRYFTQQKAANFSINGWVKNEKDGSVEIIAQGESESIDYFLRALSIGPRPYAKVTNLNVEEVETEITYDYFEIKH